MSEKELPTFDIPQELLDRIPMDTEKKRNETVDATCLYFYKLVDEDDELKKIMDVEVKKEWHNKVDYITEYVIVLPPRNGDKEPYKFGIRRAFDKYEYEDTGMYEPIFWGLSQRRIKNKKVVWTASLQFPAGHIPVDYKVWKNVASVLSELVTKWRYSTIDNAMFPKETGYE